MIRNLFIIAGSAFLLCLLSFAGVAAFGGFDFRDSDWTFSDEDGFRVERSTTVTIPDSSRDLAWTGGDFLQIDVPGEVEFTQAAEASVRATGPKELIDRLRLVDGRLTLEDAVERETSGGVESGAVSMRWSDRNYASSDGLRVIITAPNVRRFNVGGSAEVSIRGYDQPTLALNVLGSGDVRVEGATQTLTAALTGSGETDADALEVADATVQLSGSGDLRAGPTGQVSIDLSGSGDVDLSRRPATLTQSVSGSGDVNQ